MKFIAIISLFFSILSLSWISYEGYRFVDELAKDTHLFNARYKKLTGKDNQYYTLSFSFPPLNGIYQHRLNHYNECNCIDNHR